MTEKNELNQQALSLVQGVADELPDDSSQALIPTSRRNFLISSMLGVAGLGLAPIHSAIALPDPSIAWEYNYVPPAKKGFWATFLGILDLAATLFGFGGIIPTITALVKCVVSNKRTIAEDAFTNALGTLRGSGFALNIINRPRSALSEIGIRLVSGLLQSLPCASGSATSPKQLNGFTPVNYELLPPASDLRFQTPALRNDNLNGVSLYFDYTDATAPKDFDPKGAISSPTTHALTLDPIVRIFGRYGYTKESYKDAILVPAVQKESERALGLYNADYARNDIYRTKDGATFEVTYSNLTDDVNGGSGQGDITFHGLVDKSASNKRMGLKRVRYDLDYPASSNALEDGRRRVRLTYQRGYKEFRP